MKLRTALANIHNDRLWWRKILIGGALMLSVFGYPWAAGLVMESLDNARKGYPTPLPPWHEWSTRYLIGLFAVLIDFVFFVLPAFAIGLLLFCAALAALFGSAGSPRWLATVGVAALALCETAMFLAGVAPIGRLIYAQEGRPEAAISIETLRAALRSDARRLYAQARLRSLPAYLPALVLGIASWLVGRGASPGALPAALLLLWLTLSALLYAHLVVAQIYAAATREK